MVDTNNILCTLEMDWIPSLRDFARSLLCNGYGVHFEPIFDLEGEMIKDTLLVTIYEPSDA